MFYIKTQIGEETQLTTEITDENVFTRCLDCGAELQVDLAELLSDANFDLYGTGIYCSRCSTKRWKGLARHGNQQA